MAAPSNTIAIGEYVILSILNGSDIYPNDTDFLVGIVEQKGINADKVSVGQKVIFKPKFNFSVVLENDWELAHQDDIFLIYTPVVMP